MGRRPDDGDPGSGGRGAQPGDVTVLVDGRDFFAAPRVHLDGADVGGGPATSATMAWVCWDHPDMSWDASELWVGQLGVGPDGGPAVTGSRRVAGGRAAVAGPDDESVGQPTWLADGSLLFVSDAGGWWQPWRWAPTEGTRRLVDDAAEYHGPDWQLGQATLAELADGRIACRRRHAGLDQIGTIAAGGGPFEPLDQPCVAVDAVVDHRGRAAWLGATATAAPTVWWDGPTGPSPCVDSGPGLLDPGDVAVAEPFELAGRTGRTVHGLFYRPALGASVGPTATGRRSSSSATAARPATPAPASTRSSSSSRPAASRSPRSTTPAAPATAGTTGGPCGGSGASPTSTTASTWPASWPPTGWSTGPGWPSAAAAPAA